MCGLCVLKFLLDLFDKLFVSCELVGCHCQAFDDRDGRLVRFRCFGSFSEATVCSSDSARQHTPPSRFRYMYYTYMV